MKIYLSSSFSNSPEVVRVASLLESMGHKITYKWWQHECGHPKECHRNDRTCHAPLDCDAPSGSCDEFMPKSRPLTPEEAEAILHFRTCGHPEGCQCKPCIKCRALWAGDLDQLHALVNR